MFQRYAALAAEKKVQIEYHLIFLHNVGRICNSLEKTPNYNNAINRGSMLCRKWKLFLRLKLSPSATTYAN